MMRQLPPQRAVSLGYSSPPPPLDDDDGGDVGGGAALLTRRRRPTLHDIRYDDSLLTDSFQSKASSVFTDFTQSYDADQSDFHEISDSSEDLTLTEALTCHTHDLLKPSDSGGTDYSSSSRKSSATSDSAIDLHPGGADDTTSGDTSPVPNVVTGGGFVKNYYDAAALLSESDTVYAAVDAAAETLTSRSKRLLFIDAQTPSFTRLPPSVIISDHSQDIPNSPTEVSASHVQGQYFLFLSVKRHFSSNCMFMYGYIHVVPYLFLLRKTVAVCILVRKTCTCTWQALHDYSRVLLCRIFSGFFQVGKGKK